MACSAHWAVQIFGPDDRVVYSVDRETEGRFSFISQLSGIYRLCFSNKMSTVTPKTVSFGLVVGDSADSNEVAKQEHLTPLEKSVMRLSEGLQAIQAEQEYMRMRERAHRNSERGAGCVRGC